MKYSVPILIIAWRRPKMVSRLIDSLRKVKPINLYIACDGARYGNKDEAKKVKLTRETLEREIDWPCTKTLLYKDFNQGCKVGVSSAISWFFQHVEEGIILEDDCIPHQDFYFYCSELLDKYRDDERVWCISGDNCQNGIARGDDSYFFGLIPLIWGWATWRRCWNKYDVEISKWPLLCDSNLLPGHFTNKFEYLYWKQIWDELYYRKLPCTWDYQWCFTCISNNGLTAFPNTNLISNIGFGVDATHTTWEQEPNKIEKGLGEIVHPDFVLRNYQADNYTFNKRFGGMQFSRNYQPHYRISRKLKNFIKRLYSFLVP